MSVLQVLAIIVSLAFLVVGVSLLVRAIVGFVAVFRMGRPAPGRTDDPGTRTVTLVREFLGHTRMARIPGVAAAHWVTMISFGLLFLTLVTAFGQVFDAHFALPLIGRFAPFEWLTELFAWGGFFGILYLIFVRQKNHPRNAAGEHGRRSRFFGSTFWQAYFVEAVIFGVVVCIIALRALEYVLALKTGSPEASALHFPLTAWLGSLMGGLSAHAAEQLIYLVAMLKIAISFTWMIVISLTLTMGVAWHRFLAFFNIWFKRHANGRTSLGALQPMTHNGTVVTAETLEEVMDDESGEVKMGVGAVEDFTWKGLLDFSTCTECGRCQSQCPAWNTDKPLSPKLLVMAMRNHSHAKAPYVLAGETKRDALPEPTQALGELPLVGATGYDPSSPLTAYGAGEAVIDEDVLWSCTTCGACVEQCPVDIEHVDAIVDMRRHQVLIESAFPSEFGGLFKNMENKGNPWGMAPKMRLDWAKGLDFDVPVVGSDVEDLSEVDYLFWVGCAGALEDRAKKTTRAVAELLHTAGVTFAVLGEGESCTGDSARRAGNEVLFQMLAAQNVEVLNESGATRIVVTCAHCFNTIKNEYAQIGGNYEVLHHTQLLNRLVRDKRLTPVARPDDRPGLSTAKDAASTAPTVTYHDPCYLGRHNQVYAPPRELIGSLPGVTLTEMPRNQEKSFCCGAGGARMWAEEKLGTRINSNRTAEAVATGADRIAVGCPFCRVMLSDGLTAAQSQGEARDDVEVVDIAQMLLAAVRRADDAPVSGASDVAAPAAAGEDAAEVDAARRAGATDAAAPPQAPESRSGSTEPVGDVDPDQAEQAPPAAGRPSTAAPAAGAATMSASAALAAMGGGTPAPSEAAGAQTQAPAAGGKMSASDALAALGGTPAAAQPEATTSATPPTAPGDAPATPTGKMSASDALAAMMGGAAPAAPDDAAATTAPTESVAPADRASTAPGDAPATPTGKMSASDALAAMMGGAAPTAPAAGAGDASGSTEKQSQTSPAAAPATPTGKMSASDALAALMGGAAGGAAGSQTVTQPETPADSTVTATPAGTGSAPAASSAGQAGASDSGAASPATPTGKMSASEALAAMLGGAATTGGPARGSEAPDQTPAPPTQQPAAAAPTAPATDGYTEPQTDDAAAGSAATEQSTRGAGAPAVDRPVAEQPADVRGPEPKAPGAQLPTGRMSASDALAALLGSGAAAEAPQAAQSPAVGASGASSPAEAQASAPAAPATDVGDAARPEANDDSAETSAHPDDAAASSSATTAVRSTDPGAPEASTAPEHSAAAPAASAPPAAGAGPRASAEGQSAAEALAAFLGGAGATPPATPSGVSATPSPTNDESSAAGTTGDAAAVASSPESAAMSGTAGQDPTRPAEAPGKHSEGPDTGREAEPRPAAPTTESTPATGSSPTRGTSFEQLAAEAGGKPLTASEALERLLGTKDD